MNKKNKRKIFDLVNTGPSGRLKALEIYISNEKLEKKASEKINLLFRMLEDDLLQLEHYVLLDREATRETDFFKKRK